MSEYLWLGAVYSFVYGWTVVEVWQRRRAR